MTITDIQAGLADEDRAVQTTAHRFAAEILRPVGRELDRMADPASVIAPESPLWDAFGRYRELGFASIATDPDLDPLTRARLGCIVNEELSWGDVGLAISLGLSQFHGPWIDMTGDAELIERFANPDRPTIGCWALTEPDHGSDTVASADAYLADPARRPNCIARADGSDFVINGQKAAWVSNGSIADVAVLFCALDLDAASPTVRSCADSGPAVGQRIRFAGAACETPRLSHGSPRLSARLLGGSTAGGAGDRAGGGPDGSTPNGERSGGSRLGGSVFVVPLDLPGVDRPPPLDKLGQRSLNQGQIFFDEVRVPASHRVIDPELYPLALEGMLAYANAAMGQLFVGVARAAYELALGYAKERVQGGRPIFEHQSVRSRLFDMFTRTEAARALARRVAENSAEGGPVLAHSIAAKVFCTQTAFEVAHAALQVFGGNGLTREYPIEKILRDARASLIEDGCNEVLALVGAAKL